RLLENRLLELRRLGDRFLELDLVAGQRRHERRGAGADHVTDLLHGGIERRLLGRILLFLSEGEARVEGERRQEECRRCEGLHIYIWTSQKPGSLQRSRRRSSVVQTLIGGRGFPSSAAARTISRDAATSNPWEVSQPAS